MTLFSKSYLSYGVKVLCVLSKVVVLCVFSQEQIGREHVYVEYTQNVLKVLLLSTPKKYFLMRVKCEFIIFPGEFFLYYKQKCSSRRVVKIMCPCATPLGTSRKGTLYDVCLFFHPIYYPRTARAPFQ